MSNRFSKKILGFSVQRLVLFFNNLIPQSLDKQRAIKFMGHRNYVGGKKFWDQIGKLQFDFLVEQGLKPAHCFLDVGCGALRAGVRLISYLEPGNYLGLDKEKEIIRLGIEEELGKEIYELKKPEFIVSDCFEFNKFSKIPQYSIAQSLFTHLTPDVIQLCLRNLRTFVQNGHAFYATFFEGESSHNRESSHDISWFFYTREEMEAMGEKAGWSASYIGDWNHPRDQMMIKFTAS